ncbi:phospholipid/cholesterol/gamma-HCH transport system permease protein [Gammaproteobacteria bacterium]
MVMGTVIELLGFAFEVLVESTLFFITLVQGKTRFGARAFHAELRMMAIQPLLLVSIFAVSLGLILSSQALQLLDIINLEGQVSELIVLALVRDFAPIVVGIFVAGRGGLALAVHLGAMVRRREIDALILMDISRLRFVVAPTFCVNIISMVALTLWFSILAVVAAAGFLEYRRQIPITLFLGAAHEVLSWSDLIIGTSKGIVIGALVVIVSAFNGLTIDRHARSLSQVATATVVQSLLIVILIQLIFSLARA